MSIFKQLTIDRSVCPWDNFVWCLTPVEEGWGGAYYKREDHFAPLGDGGINGMKVRQLVALISAAARSGATSVVTGASVLSPQISSTAVVAKHFGLPCHIVLGGTKLPVCLKNENVKIADKLGATFHFAKLGYNPVIQRKVAEVAAALKGSYQLCYGITTPKTATDEDIEQFHLLGANQVQNVPRKVHTIHIAAGSCNSSSSLFYGIAMHPPAGLRKVVLYEIGPNRREWTQDRLKAIERVTGLEIRRLFAPGGAYEVVRKNLHESGFAAYTDRMPAEIEGIVLHPTYEGKIVTYRQNKPFAPGELFWIVGSEPKWQPMARNLI